MNENYGNPIPGCQTLYPIQYIALARASALWSWRHVHQPQPVLFPIRVWTWLSNGASFRAGGCAGCWSSSPRASPHQGELTMASISEVRMMAKLGPKSGQGLVRQRRPWLQCGGHCSWPGQC